MENRKVIDARGPTNWGQRRRKVPRPRAGMEKDCVPLWRARGY